MAKCLKEAYSELYTLYPDAHKKSVGELRDFFAPKTTGGERVVGLIVSTYKTLTEFADFDTLEKGTPSTVPPVAPPTPLGIPPVNVPPVGLSGTKELVVNINIQITLPETKDGEVYDKIFKSLSEHFFKR